MKKLLISGFEPFGTEKINPSWEAVRRLPDEIGEYSLTKIQIPVVFQDAANEVIKAADKILPDAIICVGQAGGREAITPELVAINLRYARIPDNNGNQPKDEPISDCGENAYFSTLPVRRMTEAISDSGIASQVSYSAGAYVCNDVLYTLLEHYNGTNTRVCFIHVPFCREQEKEPSMALKDMINGLKIAIESI